MIGVHWMGIIDDDTNVRIVITGTKDDSTDTTMGGGYISYKVYDSDFPLVTSLPAACAAVNPPLP